jgi:hypothetical protein
VSPLVAQIDGDSWCAEGSNLQQYAVAVSNTKPAAGDSNAELVPEAMAANRPISNAAAQVGWHIAQQPGARSCKLPNCQSVGYQAIGKGQRLELQLNLSAATSPSGKLDRHALFVFFTSGGIYLPDGRADVGLGQVTCISGCSCRPMLLDGHRHNHHVAVAANSTEVWCPGSPWRY